VFWTPKGAKRPKKERSAALHIKIDWTGLRDGSRPAVMMTATASTAAVRFDF
jgi:hypothetical protein